MRSSVYEIALKENYTVGYPTILELYMPRMYSTYGDYGILKKRKKEFKVFREILRSPWPAYTGMSAGAMLLATVCYFRYNPSGSLLIYISFCALTLSAFGWWRDTTKEDSYEGRYNHMISTGQRLGFALFIGSEVMLFFSLFWAWFHSALSPTAELGSIWPPYGILTLNPYGLPLANTLLLLSSGLAITSTHKYFVKAVARDDIHWPFFKEGVSWQTVKFRQADFQSKSYWGYLGYAYAFSHIYISKLVSHISEMQSRITDMMHEYNRSWVMILDRSLLYLRSYGGYFITRAIANTSSSANLLAITLIFGVVFVAVQYIEYRSAPFTIASTVYGSTFFMTTGLHGSHVIAGAVFLAVCLSRLMLGHYLHDRHDSFAMGIWYWHFVDVVWIFVYISLYWWGS